MKKKNDAIGKYFEPIASFFIIHIVRQCDSKDIQRDGSFSETVFCQMQFQLPQKKDSRSMGTNASVRGAGIICTLTVTHLS